MTTELRPKRRTQEPEPVLSPALSVDEPDLLAKADAFIDAEPDEPDYEYLAQQARDIFRDVQAARTNGLHGKLADLRASYGFLAKTGTNTGIGQGYKFVEATRVASKFVEEASKRNLTMLPVSMNIVDIRPSVSGKLVNYTLQTVWRITDADTGEWIDVPSFGQGADTADKALPKAQTNAMKYAILLVLQAAGDDPENDPRTDDAEASGPGKPPEQQPTQFFQPATINITASNLPQPQQGGRQHQATQAQISAIKEAAKNLHLTPTQLGELVIHELPADRAAMLLKGVEDEYDLEFHELSDVEKARYILKFVGSLPFQEAGQVLLAVEGAGDDPAGSGS